MPEQDKRDKRGTGKKPTTPGEIAEWQESEEANPDDLDEESSTQPQPTGSQEQSPDDLE